MKRSIARGFVLLLAGGLIGAGLFARSNAAQEYRPATGYAFWSKAKDPVKLAYLLGYSDAEQFYRFAVDRGIQPLCADSGKRWIADFEHRVPFPTGASLVQLKEGIDEFYKDWRNRSIDLFLAGNIVRLQLAGRPQSEIDEAIGKARAGQMEK